MLGTTFWSMQFLQVTWHGLTSTPTVVLLTHTDDSKSSNFDFWLWLLSCFTGISCIVSCNSCTLNRLCTHLCWHWPMLHIRHPRDVQFEFWSLRFCRWWIVWSVMDLHCWLLSLLLEQVWLYSWRTSWLWTPLRRWPTLFVAARRLPLPKWRKSRCLLDPLLSMLH